MWFESLVGFKEQNPEQVRAQLILEGEKMISKANGKSFIHGRLEIPSLKELKRSSPNLANYDSKMAVSELVGNVQTFHQEARARGALFQAASQFNLLEMIGPQITPEQGIDIYENDFTQGPACAIACGAGTIYRNYFVELGDQIGQREDYQIDCLEAIGIALNNQELKLWEMQNGYALATKAGLQSISKQIKQLSSSEFEALKEQLKIGIQWDTEVTISATKHLVSQAYCSALPVAYSRLASYLWEDFARLILEASYEATFYAALINFEKTGNNQLYLSLVGGGAFGNEMDWILNAIEHSMEQFKHTPLDVKIVSYGQSNPILRQFIEPFQ